MRPIPGKPSSTLASTLFALLLAPACGESGGSGDATTEPTTAGSTITEETSEATTEPTTAATVTSEATTTATAGETTSATNETTGETTGGSTIEEDCAAYCDKTQACMARRPDPGCASACAAELGFDEGECLDATQAYLQCLAGSTCEDLMGLIDPDLPWPCDDLNDVFESLCFPGTCGAAFGGDVEGTVCSAEILCPDEPTKTMECDQDECVCSIDGVPTGVTCPAMGVCATHEALPDKASECCGFSV
ncbi:hypothetical protein [Nannocystis punicea]|uniref:Uncharacterized protein n=1 Tax=Nannocystis punicea TaxID=2995304 RepID=A0ABY7GXS8_9BACT|nr:hypothetical protein [Nannocystis poenicansa]WAS91784.1 hypothetical protein O0S08_36845 [Nannocystis poenicansa]